MNFREKMLSWMPKHFRDGDYELYISATAACFEDLKTKIDDFFKETRILSSNSKYLDIHGRERGLARVSYGTGQTAIRESDINFANRVQRIKYNLTKQNIIDNVISVLGITNVIVKNDSEMESFFEGVQDKRASTVDLGGESYGNYGPLDLNLRNKCFSVMIEVVEQPPESFYDDGKFYNDGTFMGSKAITLDDAIVEVIKTLIKQKSPAGAGFRILVKDFTGLNIGTEAEQEKELNRI